MRNDSNKGTGKIRSLRSKSGTVLTEGVCSLMFLLAVIVPFVLFSCNLVAQLILQAKVSHIANQAAEAADDGKYWLGMPRPGYNEQIASDKATNVAKELCKKLGLGSASVVVTFDDKDPNFDITTCDLNVNAVAAIPFRLTIYGFDFARLFPGNVSARGVASHAKIQPYALIHMDAPHKVDLSTRTPYGVNDRDVAVFPAYGFFYQAVAGNTSVPQTPYGKGLAPNLTPENFFAMNHYHLKKTDIDYIMATGNDVQLSGWNSAHRIDNRTVNF